MQLCLLSVLFFCWSISFAVGTCNSRSILKNNGYVDWKTLKECEADPCRHAQTACQKEVCSLEPEDALNKLKSAINGKSSSACEEVQQNQRTPVKAMDRNVDSETHVQVRQIHWLFQICHHFHDRCHSTRTSDHCTTCYHWCEAVGLGRMGFTCALIGIGQCCDNFK